MLLAAALACGLVLAGRGCRSGGTQPKTLRPGVSEAPLYSAQPDQKPDGKQPADKGPADLGLPIDVVIKDVPEVPKEKSRPSPPIAESW